MDRTIWWASGRLGLYRQKKTWFKIQYCQNQDLAPNISYIICEFPELCHRFVSSIIVNRVACA